MTATKLSASNRNAAAMPTVAMTMPPMAGPITRAPLNIAEFSATALMRSSRPTISMPNDWRTGMSTAFATPRASAMRTSIQIWIEPVTTSRKTMTARIIFVTCVAMSSRRLGHESAMTPANSPNTRTGRNCAATITPSQIGSCVSVRTSHDCATCCIQVPMSEIAWPMKNSR